MLVHPIDFFDGGPHQIKRDHCFVIMPFSEVWSELVYGSIKTACVVIAHALFRSPRSLCA